jgi:hypothetical protein
MTILANLLNARNQLYNRGAETTRNGTTFYFAFTDTATGLCQYCWVSPGTGCAVVETWGSSGGGGMMCCCAGPGVPGNPGAYTRKYVRVCGSSIVCGWVGCSTQPTGLCYGGRGNCSVACIFNSGDNSTIAACAGFGGYSNCQTSTPQYCCLVAAGYCGTNTGLGCGVVCNFSGPNAAIQAPASGGDENIAGGISCTDFRTCFNCASLGYEHTLAISPGIQSQNCSTCIRHNRNRLPMQNACCGGTSGRMDGNLATRTYID